MASPIQSFPWERLVGLEIDSYRIEERIGWGAYSVVFRASPVLNDRVYRAVAIKLIPASAGNLKNIERELQAADALEHEHILGRLKLGQDSFEGQSFFYIAMPLASKSLRTRIEAGPLPADELGPVASIASALQYMHDRGYVHRDLKPENLLLVGEIWKIADFGGIRRLTSPSAQVLSGQFSLQYAPPEGLKSGEVSPAADMWALGALLVEAATGRHPFSNDGGFQVSFVATEQKPRIPVDMPEPFRSIAVGCLDYNPKTRWTAAQVCAILNQPGTFDTPFSAPLSGGASPKSEGFVTEEAQRSARGVRSSTAQMPPPESPAEEPPPVANTRSVGQRTGSRVTEVRTEPPPPPPHPVPWRWLTVFGVLFLLLGAYAVHEFSKRGDQTISLLTSSLTAAGGGPSSSSGTAGKLGTPQSGAGDQSAHAATPWSPSIRFTASQDHLALGQSTTLSWSVQGAQKVQMDGAIVQTEGSNTVTPDRTTSYRLESFGPGGESAARVVTVQVAQPQIAQTTPNPLITTDAPSFDAIDAVPNLVHQCQLVVIRWTVRNATSVTLEPDIGQAKPHDYRMVKPVQTTRVTITAIGPGGTNTRDVTVNVIPGPLTDCPH